MMLDSLNIIGERINPGFAGSKALLEARDLRGLQKLARDQVEKGARYLTINIGERAAEEETFLKEVIQAVQEVVDIPLAFDFPHRSVQEVCLGTYRTEKAGGRKPIVNSISELRWDMLELAKVQPIRLVLMASERMENGKPFRNETPEEIAETARRMASRILEACPLFTPDDLIIDVALCPLASDVEGHVKLALEAIRLIGMDSALEGVHIMVGLSNLGILLPKFAKDGSRLGLKLESAFLTVAMPNGLDTVLATPGRKYELLPEDDFVLKGFRAALELDGFYMLMRLQELYR